MAHEEEKIYLTDGQLVLIDEGYGGCDKCTFIRKNSIKSNDGRYFILKLLCSADVLNHLNEML